jgi:hypothetical protein
LLHRGLEDVAVFRRLDNGPGGALDHRLAVGKEHKFHGLAQMRPQRSG